MAQWIGASGYQRLLMKYQPQDTVMLVELRQKLNKIMMKKGQDPATLFEQIAAVENHYNAVTKKIAKDEFIVVVLDKSTMEYKSILTTEQRVKGTLCTLDDLESTMNQHWRQIGGSNEAEKNNKIFLAVVNYMDSVSSVATRDTKQVCAQRTTRMRILEVTSKVKALRRKTRESVISVAKLVTLIPTVGKMRRMQTRGWQIGNW